MKSFVLPLTINTFSIVLFLHGFCFGFVILPAFVRFLLYIYFSSSILNRLFSVWVLFCFNIHLLSLCLFTPGTIYPFSLLSCTVHPFSMWSSLSFEYFRYLVFVFWLLMHKIIILFFTLIKITRHSLKISYVIHFFPFLH